jgi:hypothetical protein
MSRREWVLASPRSRSWRSSAWLVVAIAVVIPSVPSTAGAASKGPSCNDHAELCKRSFDKVAFAATHNSMRTVADGFTAPDQARSIADQLAGGVRAFLLDVYTGTPTTDHICTDPTPLKVAQVIRDQGRAALDQLLTIRSAQCPPADGPNASLYLCHNFCELGATKLSDQLAEIRTFLKRNPNDVMTLILEDYAPAADIMQAFRDARLEKSMMKHRAGEPWPTLAAMKRKGTRLVVFSQNQGGAAPRLLDAFKEMGETPYTFHNATELSCAPNRGPAQALPLFLLNHWIETEDKRAAAKAVNAYDVLTARAKQCERERAHLPNFVAVNFAEEGDLLRVVDNLNGFTSRR